MVIKQVLNIVLHQHPIEMRVKIAAEGFMLSAAGCAV
jgi:hypothetical protein